MSTALREPAVPVGDGASAEPELRDHRKPLRPARVVLHAFLMVTALAWLVPLLYAVYTSFRSYEETATNGYVSLASSLTLENYKDAMEQGGFVQGFTNTMIVLVPSLLLILFLSSMVGFVVARFSLGFNVALLMLFTAGNLLPQQVIVTPLFQLYRQVPLPEWMSDSGTLFDSYWGIIFIHVAFQTGFCAFVLSNYMKTIPHELTEAALVDGAGVWRQYWQVILPLCRPPLAALATLEFAWIYNDFFWALTLMSSGDKRPITSSLNNLSGQFFTNNNLVAAGSLIVALPTVIIYFVLQKQFVGGLTLGSTKG